MTLALRASKRGSILVTILLMLSVLALLVATVAKDSGQTLQTVAQSGRDTQAKYAAYAGLEYTMNELRQDDKFIGERIADRHGRVKTGLDGLDDFEFDVLIWNNTQSSEDVKDKEPEDIEGPDGLLVKPDTVYLVSSGRNLQRGEEVLISSVAGTARKVRPVFDDAAYARTKMTIMGEESMIDAWDSIKSGDYVAGKFPGEMGGGGDPNAPSPTVEDYKATLGTDSSAGRTLRLVNGARLNGYYRVGPEANPDNAFGLDQGTTSSSGMFSDSETEYAVTTAQALDQIAGQEPAVSGQLGDEKVDVDSKDTDVPKFTAPYADEDCAVPPVLNNPSTPVLDDNGKQVYNEKGDPKMNPPAPVKLPHGGYTHITVPPGQTLELEAGVYYFRDELAVDSGSIITRGDGPVVIFCGKKATFHNADVNPDRRTSNLQLCFTDGDKENSANLNQAMVAVGDVLGGSGSVSPEILKSIISRQLGSDPNDREGFSYLEVTGDSKLRGGISGSSLVANFKNSEIFGSVMGNIVRGENTKIHQDLSLKGSNLMVGGGWILEGVHQLR